MKIGDNVRFLNDVGGGIVRGFKGRDIALVEDEDGFEMPVLIRECIVIGANQEVQSKQVLPSFVDNEITEDELPEQAETTEGEQLTVFLAYLANDIKKLSTGDHDCYLVNDSNYYLAYNYMNCGQDGWISKSVGTIEPNTKLLLHHFDKNELNDIEQTGIQFFVYKKGKPFAKKKSMDIELRIDTIKFYKLHSFKDNDYFNEPAILYALIEKDKPIRDLVISPEEMKEAMYAKEDARPVRERIVKKKKESEILEIDLHIHELLDDSKGLSASEMLEYQLSKFKEVMNDHLKKRGQKIVFIHGKGNGVLKSEISKELKTNYKSIYFQDASFREYGYGATMITIK